MNVNVYNKVLERVGIVMQYTSLIWDRRYRTLGDCELYLPATMDNINLLQKGYYLTRDDDDMVCIIRKIEITTDEEQGNMLIVTGKDVRCLIDQRIQQVSGKFTNALAEEAIRRMVGWAVINSGVDGDVNVIYKGNTSTKLVQTKTNSALTNRITTPYGYGNAGDKIREVQACFGWGGRMTLEQIDSSGPYLVYETYAGTDRRASVIFKPSNHNLKSSDYVDDVSGMKNVTYVVTKYKYADPATGDYELENVQYYGTQTGINRFEQLIERGQSSIQKSQVEAQFPGGTWQTAGGRKIYTINNWSFVIPVGSLEQYLRDNFPDFVITTSGGVKHATVSGTWGIAETTASTIESTTSCNLTLIPLLVYNLGAAQEANTKHPEKITFTAEIIPDLTYRYKEDYFLGDLVTVENEFGISTVARVSEVLESWDATGYSLEIKFNE